MVGIDTTSTTGTPTLNTNAIPQDINSLVQNYLEEQGPSSRKDPKKLLEEIESCPLFMTKLPSNPEENESLSALQALVYEGTPFEIANNFKEQGNEAYQEKRYKDAREFYLRAIDQLTNHATPEIQLQEAVTEEEVRKRISILYSNLAMAQLSMQNYRQALHACANALTHDPKNVKAYYRSAKALFQLDKVEEGIDAAIRGLQVDPDNKALQVLKSQLESRQLYLIKRETEQRRLELEKEQSESQLLEAIKQRKITLKGTIRNEAHSVTLDQDGILHWPVVLMYPEFKQTDFIAQMCENDTFELHLSQILPLPWDSHNKYTIDNVDLYFETQDEPARLVKFGKAMSLGKVVKHPKYVVENGVVRVLVVAKGSWADEWVKGYQKSHQ